MINKDTPELIAEALYSEMYDNCKYIPDTGGDLDAESLYACYNPSDGNASPRERDTCGEAYLDIVYDKMCAIPHLAVNSEGLMPVHLQAAVLFLEQYPLEYWAEIAREKYEADEKESKNYNDWEDTMMREYYDELRGNWK